MEQVGEGSRLSERVTRAMTEDNELIGWFKMVVGDLNGVRGQVFKHMYIPT